MKAEPCPTCGKLWAKPLPCPRCGGKKSPVSKVCQRCLGPEHYYSRTVNSNAARVKVIEEMRAQGKSWREVGEAIDVSGSRAAVVYQIHQRRLEKMRAYRQRAK